jgi:hypothetical protein
MDDGHDAHECIEETLYREQTITQQKFQQYLEESGKANAVQAGRYDSQSDGYKYAYSTPGESGFKP